MRTNVSWCCVTLLIESARLPQVNLHHSEETYSECVGGGGASVGGVEWTQAVDLLFAET